MKESLHSRRSLRRAKIVRSLQILDLAQKTGRMSEKRHQALSEKYRNRMDRLDRLPQAPQDLEQGRVFRRLPMPVGLEAPPEEAPSSAGKIFLAVGFCFLLFSMLGYFSQFVAMQPLTCVAVAIACPLLYVFIAYLFDRHEPEPKLFVIGAFIWGMISAVPALWLNNFLAGYISMGVLVCLAGVTEELTKGAGLFPLSRHPEYNDSLDGILYGMAVGFGFAAFENLLYFAHFSGALSVGMWSQSEFNAALVMRSTLSALGHASFTGVLSLMLAQAKLRQGLPNARDFIVAYLVAAALHGLFNGLLVARMPIAVVGCLVIACLLYFWLTVKSVWDWEQNRRRRLIEG